MTFFRERAAGAREKREGAGDSAVLSDAYLSEFSAIDGLNEEILSEVVFC